jgi:hypothetical protein
VLRSCSDFTFRLICMDRDDAVLHETGPFPYSDDLSIGIVLREPGFEPSRGDWQELASRLMGSQTVRLGAIAKELATLAPNGVFGDWTGARRLGFLGRLEQALLDPDGAFAHAWQARPSWRACVKSCGASIGRTWLRRSTRRRPARASSAASLRSSRT